MRASLDYIYNHPLNRSKTKQAHAFSKSPRFSQKNDFNPRFELNVSKSIDFIKSKAAGICFTKQKRDIQIGDGQSHPSPQHYKSPKGFVELSAKQNKGIAFPRSKRSGNKLETMPGPGQYHIDKFHQNPQKIFSISREKRFSQLESNTIGPGKYRTHETWPCKKAVIIGTEKRFKEDSSQVYTPSPADYNNFYRHQQQNRTHSFKFTKSPRQDKRTARKQKSPGPGDYYVQFSEFSSRKRRIYQIINRL